MNYLIDSITEYFKENPFSMDNMDIVPYKNPPSVNLGRKYSEEHKKAVSDGLKGHVISEEIKRKISASLKGRNINTSRCIIIKTPTGTFSSTSQAAIAYGVSKPTVKTWALENKNGFSIIQD